MGPNPRTLPAEKLVEHRRFLRSLARSLVRDEHHADDLVQQAWVAALERPPRNAMALRGWLAQVVRNFAFKKQRRESERPERESEAARAVTQQASNEANRDFELQAEVAEALRKLREPYRSTIHMRYYRDMGPSEIARLEGISVDTVKTRLSRGLKLLRSHLDASHGGDRSLWCASLVSLVSREPIPVAGAGIGLPAVLNGVLIMKLVSIGLISLSLSAALYYGLGGMQPGGQAEELAQSSVAESGSAPTAPPLADAGQKTVDDSEARVSLTSEALAPVLGANAAAAPARRARLRVQADSGLALSAAVVRLGKGAGLGASSAADGTAELEIDELGDALAAELEITAPGHMSLRTQVELAAEGESDLGTFVLVRGGLVRGRVIDFSGAPLPKAQVFVTAPEEVLFSEAERRFRGWDSLPGTAVGTDERGAFEIDGVRPGPTRIWAETQDARVGFSSIVQVRPGEEIDALDVRVEAPAGEDEIAGLVLLPESEEAQLVSVLCRYQTPRGSATRLIPVKENGHFRFKLSEPVPHDVWVDPASLDLRGIIHEGVQPGTLDLVLGIEQAPTVAVVVTDTEGVPLESFSMTLEESDGESSQWQSVATIEASRGSRFSIPVTRFSLFIQAEGHDRVRLGPFDPRSVPNPLRAELSPLPRIEGRVTAGGEALAGARISLTLPKGPSEKVVVQDFPVRMKFIEAAHATTDAEGRYSLTLRQSGSFYVRASAEGWAATELGPLELDHRLGGDDLDFELSGGGRIEGRVLVPEGTSLAGMIVGASRGDLRARTFVTGADGLFRFENLTPGDWYVTRVKKEISSTPRSATVSHHSQHMPWQGNCTVREGSTTSFDLDYSRGAAILQGRLALGATSTEEWKAELIRGADGFFEGRSASDRMPLDADGRFDLVAEEPGSYSLFLAGGPIEQGFLNLLSRVELGSGPNSWKLTLPLGRLEGRIDLSRHQPGSVYIYFWADEHGNLAGCGLNPASDGSFVAPAVPAGRGRIVSTTFPPASRNPFEWPSLGEVEVVAGKTAHFTPAD